MLVWMILFSLAGFETHLDHQNSHTKAEDNQILGPLINPEFIFDSISRKMGETCRPQWRSIKFLFEMVDFYCFHFESIKDKKRTTDKVFVTF